MLKSHNYLEANWIYSTSLITGRLNVSSGLDSRLWFDLYLGSDIKSNCQRSSRYFLIKGGKLPKMEGSFN